ncbi:MAG: PepSY-associated TM helix domain-containing protein [Verrucomicrobia bacterium]|nr:PepSY-associated TM helix domain-containing protein [Verrucomicrobiota bacterium]
MKSQRFAVWTRALHLYFGLFISPFILIYAISTLFLNHSIRARPSDKEPTVVPISVGADLDGMDLVNSVLGQLGLSGEILGQGVVRNGKTMIRVVRPGAIKIVTIDLEKQEAGIVERSTGLLGAITFLHFNPGLHKEPNWAITKLWGWLADSVVYLALFLTVSGTYLWFLLRTERRAGLIATGAGVLTFILLLVPLIGL